MRKDDWTCKKEIWVFDRWFHNQRYGIAYSKLCFFPIFWFWKQRDRQSLELQRWKWMEQKEAPLSCFFLTGMGERWWRESWVHRTERETCAEWGRESWAAKCTGRWEKRAPSKGERTEWEREIESESDEEGEWDRSVRDFGVLRVWGKKTRFLKFFVQKFQKPRHRDGASFFFFGTLWRGVWIYIFLIILTIFYFIFLM